MKLFRNALLGMVAMTIPSTAIIAAELKVMSTHATMGVLDELGPKFERATGNKLVYSFDPTNALKRQIEQGAEFDVVIGTQTALDELAGKGKVGARAAIGKSGLGVAVRQGAPRPDISTVEGFKQTLLSAKSVVRSTEGASGIFFGNLMTRLGIADQMKAKLVMGPSGRIAELVAKGEVELAVQQIPEILPVAGAQFVGPFPAEIQLYTTFAAGISSGTKKLEVATAFVRFLKGPEAAAVIKSKGLEPVN